MSQKRRTGLLASVLLVGICVSFVGHFRQRALIMSAEQPAYGNEDGNGPLVGSQAPDFTLPDIQGRSFTLSSRRGHPVTVAFFCGCDRCYRAAQRIGVLQRQGQLVGLVAVVALPPDMARQMVRQTGLLGVVLSDPNDTIATRYASGFCPRLWSISPAGRVAYRSPSALEGGNLTSALTAIQQ